MGVCLQYVGTKEDPLKIVRGGVFGGTMPYIKCAARLYLHVLANTLKDGYLGTEENILAISFARFPWLFHGFDNDRCAVLSADVLWLWTVPTLVRALNAWLSCWREWCSLGNHGDNCALFIKNTRDG